MPRRQRWMPVVGTGNRVYEPLERALVALADLPLRVGASLARAARLSGDAPAALDPQAALQVLVLRLDRLGDLLMALPALGALRAALPRARLTLAVGRWGEALARRAPVDEVLVWSAPWVGRADEGAESGTSLWRRARALRARRLDLALDLQGDLRANLLLAASGARRRVGYANTGGAALLTQVLPLDERVSWVEQNLAAVDLALGRAPGTAGAACRVNPVGPAERALVAGLLAELGCEHARPLVGLHPSGGRAIKQWPLERWAALAAALQARHGAVLLLTGSAADRELTRALGARLPGRWHDLAGRLAVLESMALIERLDLFLSSDTGPMHMACALGTPSLAIFGPSDPRRYFSGAAFPDGARRHRVLTPELWCAPCNFIRRPPAECAAAPTPECLQRVELPAALAAAEELLGLS